MVDYTGKNTRKKHMGNFYAGSEPSSNFGAGQNASNITIPNDALHSGQMQMQKKNKMDKMVRQKYTDLQINVSASISNIEA